MSRRAFGATLASVILCGTHASVHASDLFWPDSVNPYVLDTCGLQSGAIVIPGTAACLRLTGAVRSEFALATGYRTPTFTAPASLAASPRFTTAPPRRVSTLRDSAIIAADLRSETELGPVRLHVSIGHRDRLDHLIGGR